ncbi:MAG: hypothetical protein K6L76_09705 [Agarilytica sp.]
MMQVSHEQHRAENNKRTYPLRMLLLDIKLPENVGSMFRIADALGVEHLYLAGETLAPPNKKVKKVARSCDQYVSFSKELDADACVERLKGEGWKIISIEHCTNSVALNDVSLDGGAPICLVLGSETQGVDESVLLNSDAIVHIPMLGENASMNVANAAAICTYVLSQQFENEMN